MGLSWTHVGTFWARLGASWGRLEAVLDCHGAAWVVLSGFEPSWAVLRRFWAHFGAHFGDQNLLISSNFWGHFLDSILGTFWTTFGAISGSHFGTRSAQEGAKMGPREPPRASKTQKAAIAKTLKNNLFFPGMGSGPGFSFSLVGPLGPSPGGTSLGSRRNYFMGFLRMDAQKWQFRCGNCQFF